ncbi:MAG: phosphoadenosine phosphosulfate reductase [Armatimonadota bacterium]|nr:MAG: phosphoadenosine phosphosulfate reductase [Armatimonadota bacterium]
MQAQKPLRHILSLSGGKDSTALAVYMRDRVPEMEYVFLDTGKELPETYEYIEKLEAYLGKRIERLNPDRPFDHWLLVYNGVLPDPRSRWCTRKLKLEPFERYVGDDPCVNYVGIRADEAQRKGYISTKPNIITRFPFVEDGITKEDVLRILEESGLGLPAYYRWRSRSGCFFCFFQQKVEWLGLWENHPDLFEEAAKYEKVDTVTGERYTWGEGETLHDLINPERAMKIKAESIRRQQTIKNRSNRTLVEVFSAIDEENNEGCLVCHL